MRKRRIQNLWLLYFAADFAALAAAYYTALLMRFYSGWGEDLFSRFNRLLGIRVVDDLGARFEAFYLASALRIVLLLLVVLCVLYALRHLYDGRRFLLPQPEAWNIILCNAIVLAIIYGYFYITRNTFHPPSLFAPMMVMNAMYCVVLRGMASQALRHWRRTRGFDIHPAVILGDSREASILKDYLSTVQPHGITVAEEIPFSGNEPFEKTERAVRHACCEHDADMIFFLQKSLTLSDIMRLLELADELDVSTKVLSDQLDVLINQARMPVDMIHGTPLVHFEACSHLGFAAAIRRGIAWLAAALATLVLLPAGVVIALSIRLTSPGPVFFLQERIGVNRKPFVMFKFRTMRDRADEQQASLEALNESGEGLFKLRNDPRVTPVGRVLRRYSLDELPQLLNVLRGEMTLVGPRPLPRRDFENYYEDWHYARHDSKPGLTCLWQVSGRSDVPFHDMCILDVYYLHNQNWILDLEIILRTIWVVLFAKGAY